MNKKFKFSVIVPIYNVEEYLDDTIKSILNQTIGFEENIQLILVNDGSIDNSEKICTKYESMYPNNVLYIKQKNKGVSEARNNGKKHIKGKYVSFLDSDDKWEKHAFERVWNFFELHEKEIDIVDCRVRHFDASNKYYIFDKRYTGSRIVDANSEFELTLLNTATTFLKASAIKDVSFDSRLKYSEDTKFINEVLLKRCKFGIKHDALYLYRKRQNSNSTVDKRFEEKSYFLGPPKYCFKELIEISIKKCGVIEKFLQSLILNNIFWRITINDYQTILNKKEQKEYKETLLYLISSIDDEVMIAKKRDINQLIYILGIRNKQNVWKKIKFTQDTIEYNDIVGTNNNIFRDAIITKLSCEDNKVIIYGKITPLCLGDNFEYWIENNNTKEKIFPVLHMVKNWSVFSIDKELISKSYLFKFELPINNKLNIFDSFISYKDKGTFQSKYRFRNNLNLSEKFFSYFVIDKKYILIYDKDNIKVDKYSFVKHVKYMLIRNIKLLIERKTKTFLKFVGYYPLKRIIDRIIPLKKIIIMESNPAFSDSAKAVFDKMIEKKVNDKYKIIWFVDEIGSLENVKIKNVEFIKYFDSGKKKHNKSKYSLYCHRNAKIIIDSNRFVQKKNPKQVRIHLVHGSPIKDAAAYNLDVGNANYIVTQSKFFAPVDSKIRDVPIDKIKPLGFARNDIIYSDNVVKFDKIDNIKNKKIILWLPTYRDHQASGNNVNCLKYGLACIENEEELRKLNDKLIKLNVVIAIKFHPAENVSILENFNLSNILILKDNELKDANVVLYQLFNKVDALITDYSSVYFDFCLTKKNIGLAISDIDDYVKKQGDFQYEYKNIVVGNYMYNNNDLLDFIDDVSKGRDRTHNERMKIIKRYDDYCDGKSADRIYELVKKHL